MSVKTKWMIGLIGVILVAFGCTPGNNNTEDLRKGQNDVRDSTLEKKSMTDEHKKTGMEGLEKATLGAGCFWCVEAVFSRLEGVTSVSPGYAGGHVDNPTYEQVCTGNTGHAEVCRIVYDPDVISYEDILEVFWATHDPTTKNRQGPDVGPQYRSAIFYHNDEQKKIAETSREAAEESGAWDDPIVTEIEPLDNYYPAEDYHENYYENNPDKAYCQAVIRPKIEKFKKRFRDKLKKTNK